MAIGGISEKRIEEWLLDTKQYRGELRTVAGELRKEAKAAKDAALVQQQLASAATKAEKHLGAMGKSMVGATLIAGGLQKAFGLVKNSLGSLVDVGLTWNDWIGDNSAALDGMSQATAGIIGKLDLVRARTKLTTGDFAATEGQLQSLAKAAVVYARVVKVDLRTAVDALSDAVASGRDTPLRRMGFDIELVGSKSQKAAQVLEVLEGRFGSMKIKAENLNEELSTMSASWKNATGELGHAIIAAKEVRDIVTSLTAAVKVLTGDVGASAKAFRSWLADFAPLMFAGASLAPEGSIWAQQMKDIKGLFGFTGKVLGQQKELARLRKDYAAAVATGPQQPTSTGKGRGKGKGKGKGRGKGKGPSAADRAIAAAFPGGGAFGGIAVTEELIGQRAEEAGVTGSMFVGMGPQVDAVSDALQKGRSDIDAYRLALEGAAVTIDDVGIKMGNMATGGLANFAAGMWSAIDAAVTGEKSIGMAMAGLLKSVLMSMAAEATALAVMETIKGFAKLGTSWGVPNPGATAHFTAAGIAMGFAGAAGVAGLAVSAGMSSASGKPRGAGASAGSSAGSRSTYRPSPGASRKSEDKAFKPTLNIYLDPQSPMAGLHWKEQIKAQVRN